MTAPFMQAAASYFGLGETRARRAELFTDGGEIVAVFEVVLGPDDMAGVIERMKVLQTAQAGAGEAIRDVVGWTAEELREQYQALSPRERSQFGSFAKYLAFRGVTSDAADFGGLPG